MSKSTPIVATMGIDIGKNSFHVVGLDQRGALCGRSGRAARSKRGSRTYRPARSGWRRAFDSAKF
jgi:hypothetical protein